MAEKKRRLFVSFKVDGVPSEVLAAIRAALPDTTWASVRLHTSQLAVYDERKEKKAVDTTQPTGL